MLKTELKNGVVIYQVTQEKRLVSNIYCERPFCSVDSKRFLYARQNNDAGPNDRQHWEYVLCKFGTWEEEIVGNGFLHSSISYGNDFYFQRPKSNNHLEFVRLDMDTGSIEQVWSCPSGTGYARHPTVSVNQTLLAYHYALSYSPQRFGVVVVNLQTGHQDVVYEHPHLCNAHLQFHPADNRTLLVQLNRGCEYTADGERLKLVGSEGATLLLLDALSGKTEYLPIGTPYTPAITGHQTWLGSSENIVATVAPKGEYVAAPGKGSVVLAARGTPCRQLGTGIILTHIGSTPCGRYFFGDCVFGDYIAIGSPVTGKTVTIHNDPEQAGDSPYGQQSHPHAYLTQDFKWIVFNSDRTGRPQVYVARIPPELLKTLESD